MSDLVEARFEPKLEGWRTMARHLLETGVAPDRVAWLPAGSGAAQQTSLPALLAKVPERTQAAPARGALRVPASFFRRAETAVCHRDERKWALLYRIVYRCVQGASTLLSDPLDEDGAELRQLVREVTRDEHRAHAFVRFRRVSTGLPPGCDEHFVAYHRPDHLIVERVARFFVERLNGVSWSLLTPDGSAHWNGTHLRFGAGQPRAAFADDDALEEMWRTYYASTFNPARVNLRAMRREMPRRHWASLPEAPLFAPLAAAARPRAERMVADTPVSAAAFVPPPTGNAERDQRALAASARGCRGCPLWQPATQTVFGVGPARAELMLVGEQPGDQEDRAGAPFVGPAGQVLDGVLAEAGIDRARVYLTNAVKHFRFEPRGSTRLHVKPRGRDVQACVPWLAAEIGVTQPRLVVALGATAAAALFGATVRPVRDRGQTLRTAFGPHGLVTFHPSAVLRARDPEARGKIRSALLADLRAARAWLDAPAPAT